MIGIVFMGIEQQMFWGWMDEITGAVAPKHSRCARRCTAKVRVGLVYKRMGVAYHGLMNRSYD